MMKHLKALRAAYWVTTSFFSLWMLFTAYAQLALPQVHQMFTHLGFPNYFRASSCPWPRLQVSWF